MDRLEQLQISTATNLKKEQFNKIVDRYNSIIEGNKPVNSDTINKDRKKLRKLLNN